MHLSGEKYGLAVLLGWREVLMVHVPIMVVASIVGVWLFTLQHRFEAAQWTNETQWSFTDAALNGSSWLRLPRVLQWMTGNIGFHHIHHLDPRVPNYRLGAAHTAVQKVRPVRGLGVMDGLRAPLLTLWDETSGRLVRFSDAAIPAALDRDRFSRSERRLPPFPGAPHFRRAPRCSASGAGGLPRR